MGDDVGQLLYGVEIDEETFDRLLKEAGVAFYDEFTVSAHGVELKLELPYETEDRFLMVASSEINSRNGAKLVEQPQLIAKNEWNEALNQFCLDHKVKPKPRFKLKDTYVKKEGVRLNKETDFDTVPGAPSWFLIGHYA